MHLNARRQILCIFKQIYRTIKLPRSVSAYHNVVQVEDTEVSDYVHATYVMYTFLHG